MFEFLDRKITIIFSNTYFEDKENEMRFLSRVFKIDLTGGDKNIRINNRMWK